ncbi:MAG: TIGR04211 family SH3 domain-containing protein [Desulfobulbaceae bacterium]|uniref:TIGR04211 family SH3 domain-containing protein n=1 Tax=Candidatus Desulfobia pelagia TaxID=2841692 RepID=A0A8J6NDF7_9BACT|nr:TIGR04211 family SH3 domain-containing protein [Candidatus Desulfobia pelagia]
MAVNLLSRVRIVIFSLFLLIAGFGLSSIAGAETRYIHDVLIVDVRDNMGKQYKVLTTVRTGDALEVLEDTKHFVKVKTSKGVVGYISRQYVVSDLPKKTIINSLKSEMKSLNKKLVNLQADKDGSSEKLLAIRTQNESYKQELSSTAAERDNVIKELERCAVTNHEISDKLASLEPVAAERDNLEAELKKLQPRISLLQDRYDQALENNKEAAELIGERDTLHDKLINVQADLEFLKEKHQQFINDSEDLVSLIDERDSLFAQAKQNDQVVKELRERNDELEGTHMVYWFLAGAGVLLIGMLIGKASIRKKRGGLSGMFIVF